MSKLYRVREPSARGHGLTVSSDRVQDHGQDKISKEAKKLAWESLTKKFVSVSGVKRDASRRIEIYKAVNTYAFSEVYFVVTVWK